MPIHRPHDRCAGSRGLVVLVRDLGGCSSAHRHVCTVRQNRLRITRYVQRMLCYSSISHHPSQYSTAKPMINLPSYPSKIRPHPIISYTLTKFNQAARTSFSSAPADPFDPHSHPPPVFHLPPYINPRILERGLLHLGHIFFNITPQLNLLLLHPYLIGCLNFGATTSSLELRHQRPRHRYLKTLAIAMALEVYSN